MIRSLLTTTALAALLTTGALAQDAAAPNQDAAAGAAVDSELLSQGYQLVDTDGLASRLIGMPIYTSAAADAERIGEVNDLVINESGDVAAVIVGVGGFLGIGEKSVAVEYDQLQWTNAEDNTERLVLETTKEALNAAPAVEFEDDEPQDTAAVDQQQQPAAGAQVDQSQQTAAAQPQPDAAAQPAGEAAETAEAQPPADAEMEAEGEAAQTAEAQPQPGAAAQPQGEAAQTAEAQPQTDDEDRITTGAVNPDADADRSAFDRTILSELDETTLTAEEMIGTTVYGPNDENVGVIGDFVFAEDGKTLDAVVVDVGGFLGIGAKEVAIGFENLNFATDANGNRYLLVDFTKEQLEAQVEFNRDTYMNERDQQRMVSQG